jgi:hypothetical protein
MRAMGAMGLLLTGAVLGSAGLTYEAEDGSGQGGDVVPTADADLEVRLAHDSEAERRTKEQLLRVVEAHDVSGWLYTKEIVIDETEIPHSHPVLTLHTRHLGDDAMLLSTFVHEEFHWLEDGETLTAFRAAMRDFAELYPEAPAREGGGARDVESTYRHLVVCDLELQALTHLLGEHRAREVIASITHYEWIYQRVLDDPGVREITARHGFVLEALPLAG